MAMLDDFRQFFAASITASVGIAERNGRLESAFAATPREHFVHEGPWRVFTPVGYIQTPSKNPALLYQDILVAIDERRQINIGQPSLHAESLAAVNVKERERVIQVGAGSGYYTAVLARLVGERGEVIAYELEQDLATQAAQNLADLSHVQLLNRSGSIGPLPPCDVIYVCAGATGPVDAWLEALRPGGRLVFPLIPSEGLGGMLLITRTPAEGFEARFTSRAMFVPCADARDAETAGKLSKAFLRDDMWQVKSLRRDSAPDDSCWVAGRNWWLSKAPVVHEN